MHENILIPNAKQYHGLNHAKNTIRLYDALSIWPNWAPDERYAITSNEYWRLSELLDIVNPQERAFFANPLTLDMALGTNTPKEFTKQNNTELAQNHIRPIRENTDMELSRYAAWTLVKEIGKTMSTSFVQEYFLNPHDQLADIYKKSQATERIRLRERVTALNNTLDGIFNSLGATSQHFAKFNHEKIEWLFNKKSKKDIIKQCQLLPNVKKPKMDKLASPSHTYLYDYMDVRLLNAYIKAAENIIEKWDNNPKLHNYFALRDMTYNEMNKIVVDFWCHGSTSPNASLRQYGVKTIEEWQKTREFEFAKKYINVKVR